MISVRFGHARRRHGMGNTAALPKRRRAEKRERAGTKDRLMQRNDCGDGGLARLTGTVQERVSPRRTKHVGLPRVGREVEPLYRERDGIKRLSHIRRHVAN